MRKLAIVGACLLFGLLAGLTFRPDDGTQVSLSDPAETGAAVSGANHGKPLPRITTAHDLITAGLHAVGLVLALRLVLVPVVGTPVRRDADRAVRRPEPLSRALSRRGPPALA
jgi:hypothetical protein